ncbi:hypothetical protein [Serinicoccus profundi]|uniref:hypothetical protein n=1 Tax=Serinicoccus profundi TaxID=1078471 RepID=UPI000255EF09|nr:hypothetical protein [Serinicoccus profundi]
MDGAWHEYQRWAEAIAEVVYPFRSEAVPAYLDVEEEDLHDIASAAGWEGPAKEGLRDAVLGVTVLEGKFSLTRLAEQASRWRRSLTQDLPPPWLPFQAITVLAAEAMGAADDGFNQNNYYARLCTLLRAPADSQEVRWEYTHRAEQMWGDLNRWLEGLEGRRGTPTAYSLSYRYVGLPLSQALVRAGDRRKFPVFFVQYGLPAGTELAPEAVERYLDAWFGSETCPMSAALQKLWQKGSARERISAVAAVELAGWDGTVLSHEAGSAPALQRIGLMAQLRRGFMGESLDLALTLRAAADDTFGAGVLVEGEGGEWMPVGLVPAVANVWRTSYSSGIDVSSVLEGVVRMKQAERPESLLTHHPRSIVPLVFDELQAAYVETERLQLNVESMLLVRASIKGGALVTGVEKALRSCARPGFAVVTSMDGLPSGWTLIAGVQLFGSPGPGTYNELVPLARDQLTIAGGMRIPSRIRKWSVASPPEVRASVESDTELKIVLSDAENLKDELHSWTAEGGALVVPLTDARLAIGDYSLALYAGSAKAPLQRATVRLRSADEVDSAWSLAPRLVYDLSQEGGPIGALSAPEMDPDGVPDVFIDGALAVGTTPWLPDEPTTAPRRVDWSSNHAASAPPIVRVGAAEPNSCVITGAHYLEYPTFMGGWQPKYIAGVCKFCGLAKRSPGWIPKHGQKKNADGNGMHVDVDALPPIETDSIRLWDAALDALMHLGGGPAEALSTVASQIDGSALFTSAFPIRMELLGHIAVERSELGAPQRWEISPSCLVVRGTRCLELVGFWPEASVAELLDRFAAPGLRLREERTEDQPTRRLLEGIEVGAVEVDPEPGCVVHDPCTSLLNALPALSAVAGAYPRVPMPGFTQAERFDVASASWVQTSDVSHPGAYRLTRGFERIHVFRSEADVMRRSTMQGPVHLVKYLAANALGRSLVAYLPKRQGVIVPLGCDLPGLYGRAVVLASGTLPRQMRLTGENNRRCLLYPSITPQQADLLVSLLTR